ncbi:hypothetical protein D9M68_949600 [compost metagenome]
MTVRRKKVTTARRRTTGKQKRQTIARKKTMKRNKLTACRVAPIIKKMEIKQRKVNIEFKTTDGIQHPARSIPLTGRRAIKRPRKHLPINRNGNASSFQNA